MPSRAGNGILICRQIGPQGLDDPQLFLSWQFAQFGNAHVAKIHERKAAARPFETKLGKLWALNFKEFRAILTVFL